MQYLKVSHICASALAGSLTPLAAQPHPLKLEPRVTTSAVEILIRVDTPRHLLLIKRGPGADVRILWPTPRPDSLPLLQTGDWVVVRRPAASAFRIVSSVAGPECWLVAPRDSTLSWNGDCGLGPGYVPGPSTSSSGPNDDYAEVLAVDLGRSFPATQLEAVVSELPNRGGRRAFIKQLLERLDSSGRNVAWTAVRVPALRN